MGPHLRRAACLPVLVLVVTACVATADDPSPAEGDEFLAPITTSTTPDVAVLEESLSAFRSCLGELGVVIDEVTLDGRGRPRLGRAMTGVDFSDGETMEAIGECAPMLADGALDTSSDPRAQAAVNASLEQFAGCLRRLGVDSFPDPVRGFNGVGEPFNRVRVPWTDPDLAGAVAVCSERMRATSS